MTQTPSTGLGSNLRAHRGVLILVFGILGWVVCLIFGIVAWVMGNSDLKEMAEGRMDPAGEGLTKAGKIVGMLSVIIGIGFLILMILLMTLGIVGGIASGSGGP